MRSSIRSMHFLCRELGVGFRLRSLRNGCVEGLLVAQDAPCYPRQLVGQGRCQLVAVQPWSCVLQPCSEAESTPIVRAHQETFAAWMNKVLRYLLPRLEMRPRIDRPPVLY